MSEKIKLKRINSERAAYFHALSATPEEDAWNKAEIWAKKKGLLKKNSKTRIFGRNTYPTENPEPHGYGYFITVPPDIEIEKDIIVREIPEGLYVITKCDGIEKIGEEWANLWNWVNISEYEYIGETKGEYGFELGFEEHLNWYSSMVEKTENKFKFNLMLQLKE